MKTLNTALEIARTGNWNEAWKVAQEDEGLLNTVTFEDWKSFAIKTIAKRDAEKETQRRIG